MLLSCQHLEKSFGGDLIIRDASFGIEDHEKAALVGINGAGKSTLLKMIVGETSPDSGSVTLPRTARLGYLAQQEMLHVDGTVWDAMADARKDIYEAEHQLREMEHDMKGLTGALLDEAMERYHRLAAWYEQENGYALESEITGVLKGLGFLPDEFSRHTADLSGGQRTRVALGRLLLSAPDIILLDEPTNHLDMPSVAWLENYLSAYKGSVLIVAHDRYFLDKVVTKVIEVENGETTVYMGNYTAYAQQKKSRRDAQQKAWQKQQEQIRHQQEVITRLRSFNREKSIRRAESREKMLERMTPVERPANLLSEMKINLRQDIQSGRDVLTARHLGKAYGSNILFEDLDLFIRRGEKTALIGENGVGKTTLLKIIAGMLSPDVGTVRLGTNVTVGYYDQDHRILHEDKTLFDEISDTYPDMDQTEIRNLLASFLFTGDDVFKLSGSLSGGERGRMSLAKLMLSGANFLLLDEPTNHLDMVSREILEDALRAYDGTVMYVSHDRYFINRTATRILELTDDGIRSYEGDYDYYLEKKAQLAETVQEKKPGQKDAARGDIPAEGTEDSRQKWLREKQELSAQRKRMADISRIEEEISRLEDTMREIDDALIQESNATDPKALLELSARREDCGKKLSALYASWEELMDD